MRLSSDLLLTMLVSVLLLGLAELAHRLLLPPVLAIAPSLVPFTHAGLLALALFPVFFALLRQQGLLKQALHAAQAGERATADRLRLVDEALESAQFAAFEYDVDTDRVHVYGGAGAGVDGAGRTFSLDAWNQRCHPDELPARQQAWAALLDGAAPDYEQVYRVLDRSGAWRWQRVRARVSQRDASGRVRRVAGTSCDITPERGARLALLAGQRLLHSVLEMLPVAVFWKDLDGRYLGANRAFLRHYGRSDVIGLCDGDFLDEAHASRFRQHDLRVIEGALEERNVLREDVDGAGTQCWYLSSKAQLRNADGEVIGVVGTFDDVTELKHTEQRLRETSERFELALDGSSDGLWDWDLQTNEVYYSPRFKALLGYGDDEYGNDFAAYEACLHPADLPLVHAALERHLRDGDDADIEYRMRHRSGEWRWYRTRGLAIPDADGVRTRMAGTLSDVTERKARELEIAEARAHLSEATEALDSGIVMFDADMKLVFCNSRYQEFYGLSPQLARPGAAYRELLQDFYARFPQQRPADIAEDYAARLFARHRAGGAPWELELAERWLLISERPTQDGGVVCLHTDITHIKRGQRELEQALQRAEAANRAKSQFVANVSHELRTPLNGVLGMLQLLDEATLVAPHDEYVRVALQAGRALLSLINDVLDLARNEAGPGEVGDEVFNLPLLVDEIVAAHARRAATKGLQLLPFIDPAVAERVHGDPARLGQVLSKLLGNAIKFTERGEVRIELRGDPEVQNGIRIVIDDTGIGIPLECQSTIFEPFTQGDGSYTRRYGGTGLGLALTRQQLRLMGGEIEVTSAPGRGSRFDCRLVLPAAAGAPVPLPTRALIVGVESALLRSLEALLQRAGAIVSYEADPVRAAARLDAEHDWVFCDVSLGSPALARLVRAAQRRNLRCAGFGVPNDEPLESVVAAICGKLLRAPLSYASVLALLQTRLVPPDASASDLQGAADAEVLDDALAMRLGETLGAAGFAELVETLDRSIRQRLADYGDAVATGDALHVQRLTHAMKGIGANLGAARFASLCADVGQRAACGDLDDYSAALLTAFDPALAGLRQIAGRFTQDVHCASA